VTRWRILLLAVLLAALVGCTGTEDADSVPSAPTTTTVPLAGLPNPELTPGVVLTTRTADICTPGWASKHRKNLTAAEKARVLTAYGYPATIKVVEMDHLISLELGGGNGPRNIWPQLDRAAATRKDHLEGKLARLVCSGQLAPVVAQERIRTFWDDPLW
jgi:hypothetical protein